jgi:hypothetical protein
MKNDCWLSVLDYVKVHADLALAIHKCKEHDMSVECRNVRVVLTDKLSDADMNVLKACESEE